MGKPKGPQWPVLGPNDTIAQGDSHITYDSMKDIIQPISEDPETAANFFKSIKDEVPWQTMSHRKGEVPRLVCTQGDFLSDGSMPIYRHPADEHLPLLHWSSLLERIRDRVQVLVGHPMNHCLIQLYRTGYDYISEHSDKTLDIVRGSSIVNVSLGAQRTMRLRTKRVAAEEANDNARRTQLVPLPHGSIFVLGQHSNMKWLHGINPDKRPEFERSYEEKAFNGERISLTFRHIGTFLDARQKKIWGQGARGKTKEGACNVVNHDERQAAELIKAFGVENHSSAFEWDKTYGQGFDVVGSL